MSDPTQPSEDFITYYDEYSDAIFRFCITKIRNRDLALDIVQDTFIKAWEYVQAGNTVKNMRALLYRIARNLIIDSVRKKKSESLDHIIEAGVDFESHAAEATIYRSSEMRIALEALDSLDQHHRELITMRYIDGMSVKEIAELTEQTTNSVSVRLHRALKQTHKIFQEQLSK